MVARNSLGDRLTVNMREGPAGRVWVQAGGDTRRTRDAQSGCSQRWRAVAEDRKRWFRQASPPHSHPHHTYPGTFQNAGPGLSPS